MIALVVGLVLTPLSAEPARAGTYDMWSCNVPGQPISLLQPWQPTDWLLTDVSTTDACATGGGWGINFRGARQVGDGYGVGVYLLAPTGPRSEIKFVKVMVWYSARLTGSGQSIYFDVGDLRPDGFHQVLLAEAPGTENAVAERELSADTSHIQFALRCGLREVASVEPCVAAHDEPLLIHGIKVTLREDVPPIVLRLGGTLLEDGQQSGVRTVTYSASDPQSGISKVDVLLDETVVASNDLATRCTHSDFTACPPSEDGMSLIDTRAVTNGPHRLALRVSDAAGNERLVYGDRTVDIANERSPTSSSVLPYALSARFKDTTRSTLTVPYGARVALRGRLTHGTERAAAGMPIDVLATDDLPGAAEVSRARVKTKRDGSFSAVLEATRPSGTVRLAFRPLATAEVLSSPLTLRVRAGSRLRATLRGRIVSFSGRVLSRPIPKRGKQVVLEGRSPGSAWTAFKVLRTNRQGRFSGTYRLRVRRPGVLLKIRAVVPREDGYGYLGSRSRAVLLRVR